MGVFYEHLEEYYPRTYDNFRAQRISATIREGIKNNFDINTNDQGRLINYVLEQAFVPINYLSAFFEFMLDIYRFNYDYLLYDTRNADEINEKRNEIKNVNCN